VFAALAGLTKFAPLALAPLLATHGVRDLPTRAGRASALGAFALAFLATAALVAVPALAHDSWHTIYERTFAYQANRGSPFSVWGLYGGLGSVQKGVEVLAVGLAVGLALVPRRPDVVGLAAALGAVVIATQLGVEHWFYLYVPWFFGLAMLALLGRASDPLTPPAEDSAAGGGLASAPEDAPLSPVPGEASESALLSRPAAPSSSGLGRPSATDPLLRFQSVRASA
jgi:hypothetical protein